MQFFERQRESRARTWHLLGMFALVVLALVVTLNAGLAVMWRWLSPWPGYPAYFFQVNTAIILLFVLGGWWVETSQLSLGGAALAQRVGARPAHVDGDLSFAQAERRFHRIVQELALASDLPVPQAYVLATDPGLNAFAAGWDEDDAVVAVTAGALMHLNRDELMGLVAHELSHIREGDTRLNMRLSGMVFGLEMIHNMGQTWAAPNERGHYSAIVPLGWVVQALGWCGWLAGRWLKAAVSREREFLADARAVQFTRSKEGIGGVLRKIAYWRAQSPVPSPHFPAAMAHMLLVEGGGSDETGHFFASHPPLDERIRRVYGRPMPDLPIQMQVIPPHQF